MSKEKENQRIPLYRTRIIFLIIVALLMAYPLLWIFFGILGEYTLEALMGLFLASFLIVPVLLFDLIGNAKLLRTDTLPRRRIVSWIVLSVEILILLALCGLIFLGFYIVNTGGILG